jgi:hypothetical protein
MPLDIIRELYDASWGESSNLSALIVSSELVAKTIAAAGIDLAGPKHIEANWLVVPTVPGIHFLRYIAILFPEKVRFEVQRSERCFVSTTGGAFFEVYDERANLVRATVKSYRFDDRGALICVRTTNCTGNVRKTKPRCVRAKDTTLPLTDELALGIMAALLKEFRKFRFSLSRRTVKQHEKIVTAGKRYYADLAKHLKKGPPDPAAGIVRELCGLLTEEHEGQIEFIEALPQRPRKPRAQFMGPLQVAFGLLFGKAATSRYVPIGPNAQLEADSPFIRFAEAFFSMVGCPCKRNTINRDLISWRASQKRR